MRAVLVAALQRLQRPYESARARYRLADAPAGGRDREEAAALAHRLRLLGAPPEPPDGRAT
ncbi:hypothetical protein AB0H29_25270 [Streptomyces thermolilacinus]